LRCDGGVLFEKGDEMLFVHRHAAECVVFEIRKNDELEYVREDGLVCVCFVGKGIEHFEIKIFEIWRIE
jgi:hypothetical protein